MWERTAAGNRRMGHKRTSSPAAAVVAAAEPDALLIAMPAVAAGEGGLLCGILLIGFRLRNIIIMGGNL